MQWEREQNSNEKYKAYLCSREWIQRKDAVRRRSKGTCERCHRDRASQCHHKTYARLFNEPLTDLQDLCDGCHRFVHNKTDFDPVEYFREQDHAAKKFSILVDNGSEKIVQCPKCKGEFDGVHVDKVAEYANPDDTVFGIQMWCECGHFFTWSLTTHKGSTYFDVQSTDPVMLRKSDIWRQWEQSHGRSDETEA